MARNPTGIIRYSSTFIIQVLSELDEGRSMASICHKHGITPRILLYWQSAYSGIPISMLRRLCYLEERVRYLEGLLEREEKAEMELTTVRR
jgi:transposase-like protein